MKLNIKAFRISLSTDQGPYGTEVRFADGLNVVRAENTSGKSALLNGILYALGCEALVGKRGVEATKPVLHSGGEYGAAHFNVIESYVELEIANAAGVTVTVRRWIKGDKDERLVEVLEGPVLTGGQATHYPVRAYFVGIEGAAQRERGFHQFLADFLQLDLPRVKRFSSSDVPLYMECILPLMFIEQVRGWSGIQASLRQNYGIRDAAKRAVEYVLALDVSENERRRTEIVDEANRLQEDWRVLRERMVAVASRLGGTIVGVPSSPVTELPDEPWIAVLVDNEQKDLGSILVARRTALQQFTQQPSSPESTNQDLQQQLEELESNLLTDQAALTQLRTDVRAEDSEIAKLHERLDFIEDDIHRNKDIIRLRQYGMTEGLHLPEDRCPTCNQHVGDSLLTPDTAVMSIDDNIQFLEGEKQALTLLIEGGSTRVQRLRGEFAAKSRQVGDIRARVRDLRSDVLQTQSISVAEIRQQVQSQEEIVRLEGERDEFQSLCDEIERLATEWGRNRTRLSQLPEEYFSESDKTKLTALSQNFDGLVASFGYRSTTHSHLHISEDHYRPICEDFEVSFGASASDNIRLIWAYTLAILQTSLRYGCNHWGIVVFDEPEQQQMRQASADALYTAIAAMNASEFQLIVATSAPTEVVQQRLTGLQHNLIEFGDKVIRPLR